jgi:predicted nucleic acid-binding protein
MNAVDTNILVYSIDRREPVKRSKARDLLRQLRSTPGGTLLLW